MSWFSVYDVAWSTGHANTFWGERSRERHLGKLVAPYDTMVFPSNSLMSSFYSKGACMEPRISIITLGVKDMPSAIDFYKDGLGFPTNGTRDDGWIIFHTSGTRFSLFPKEQLAHDINTNLVLSDHGFYGITLAHNVKEKADVDRVLKQAESCGGNIVKAAQDAEWGGYSGYFTDLDGYYWEVAWSEEWEFDENGILWGGSLGSQRSTERVNTTEHA